MTIDTAEKRLSAVNITCPWRGLGAFPDGVVLDNRDRFGVAYLYSGFTAGNAYLLTALSGSYSWDGSDAIFTPTTHINTPNERFSVMNVSSPWRGLNTFPQGSINLASRYSLSKLYDGFAVATVNAYTLTAESGVFVWDGEPSFSDFEISCISGVYTWTGNSATIIATRTLFAGTGVYTWTGYDANLIKFTERTLQPNSGVYSWVGSDAIFSRPRTMVLDTGTFSWIGQNAVLTYTDVNGRAEEGDPGRRRNDAGGRKKRKKYEVEIDGEVYLANSEDEALHILEKTKEEAEATAKLAIERATRAERRPVRKALADAKKALQTPEIDVSEVISEPAQVIRDEIDELYKDALRTIEIAALMRKQAEDEEEALLLMLL